MFLLILFNLRPNKPPFSPYYPKSVPNSGILIISPIKNDKILVLAKISFLTIFLIFAMEISFIEMHWWGKHSTLDIFQTCSAAYVLLFILYCP